MKIFVGWHCERRRVHAGDRHTHIRTHARTHTHISHTQLTLDVPAAQGRPFSEDQTPRWHHFSRNGHPEWDWDTTGHRGDVRGRPTQLTPDVLDVLAVHAQLCIQTQHRKPTHTMTAPHVTLNEEWWEPLNMKTKNSCNSHANAAAVLPAPNMQQ